MTSNLISLLKLALSEFSDIVTSGEVVNAKLRLYLQDGSYLDFWWSEVQPGRFAHHWDRRMIDSSIFRHDNSPHTRWKKVSTFPKHFHRGNDQTVEAKYRPKPFPTD